MIRFVRPAAGILPEENPEAVLADKARAIAFLRNVETPGLEWLWPAVAELEDVETGRIQAIIKQWICVLRDVGVLLSGCGELAAFNPEQREELVALTGQWTLHKIAAAIQLAEQTRRHLQRNANSRLMLEALLIRSADLYWGGK